MPEEDRPLTLGSDCIEWWGRLNGSGYGTTYVKPRSLPAHRHVWQECFGDIPKGMEIDHLCGNRRCVNPAHMEVVTHAENMRRYFATITHCPHGHSYEGAPRKPNGKRRCIECERAYDKERRT